MATRTWEALRVSDPMSIVIEPLGVLVALVLLVVLVLLAPIAGPTLIDLCSGEDADAVLFEYFLYFCGDIVIFL